MGSKLVSSLLVIFLLAGTAFGQATQPVPNNTGAVITNKTDGLELPADAVVNYDEGFVTIEAKCRGQVKWMVISSIKVKYRPIPSTNSIVLSIPPKPGTVISVVAVGLVDNKLSEFCRTNITVGGAPTPIPTPTPNPTPTPAPNPGGQWHYTFILNYDNMTPELAALLNSASLRQALEKNGVPRTFDIRSPVVKERNLENYFKEAGGQTVLIIQRSDGFVAYAKAIPKTEAEILQVVAQITGNR